MRIRSIKPEFWTSEDIASVTWEQRLLFIGLWSYVDDNGVGRDVDRLIASSLFPLEEDPRETLAIVSRGLQWLSGQGLITRYMVDGKPFLHIAAWDKHQRIDKPNKSRYELPTCENAVISDTLATPSRDSLAWSRGTGDQGKKRLPHRLRRRGRPSSLASMRSGMSTHGGSASKTPSRHGARQSSERIQRPSSPGRCDWPKTQTVRSSSHRTPRPGSTAGDGKTTPCPKEAKLLALAPRQPTSGLRPFKPSSIRRSRRERH